MDAGPKVATTLLLMLVSWSVHAAAGADRWQSLRDNNPFQPYQPPAPVVEPPPPNLELRGVLVEGRVTWFNVYDAETKESAWVRRGDQMASYTVKDYDAGREALQLDYRQRPVSVALKQSKIQLIPHTGRGATAVASLSMPANRTGSPSMAPALPAAENQRLEQVAEQIRQRREARRKTG
jgi:hypothetical protein